MTAFRAYFKLLFGKDRQFAKDIQALTGYPPRDTHYYHLAFKHSSLVKTQTLSALECNERLEYLGDSVLGSVVAEYLYRRYPLKDEGFLTEMRSRIVSRNTLNEIGEKLGFEAWIEFNTKNTMFRSSMYGNTLEAFIGALFLDQGYKRTQRFIVKRIIQQHLNIDLIQETNSNFKSLLMEYVQKNKLGSLNYIVHEDRNANSAKQFIVLCEVNKLVIGYGIDSRKKNSEQKASEMAYLMILEKGHDPRDWNTIDPLKIKR
jgi:ribonuclease-3